MKKIVTLRGITMGVDNNIGKGVIVDSRTD